MDISLTTSPRPLIGLSSCVAFRDGGLFHEVKDQYHRAVLTCTRGIALSVPASHELMDGQSYIDSLDGLVLTGSISNVHPSRYGDLPTLAAEPYDQQRDATNFRLLELGLASGLPILCICRGFQEAVTFFGGTLYPLVHEVQGMNDHRHPRVPDVVGQFAFNHTVEVFDGQWAGWMTSENCLPVDRRVKVNSLHLQGVKDMPQNLHVEARASDSLVEAFSVPDAPGFFWAAQFHPEWDAINIPQYRVIWRAFDQAAMQRQQARR